MNREFAKQFGREPDLLPLKTAAHIVPENALMLNWAAVVAPGELDYIIGNPPFVGSKYQTPKQKDELASIFGAIQNAKQLDFVACWYKLAANYMEGHAISAAFVSTNSIAMGEQVAPLWAPLIEDGLHINFAHQTFAWSSEAKGKAAVHVVIIGFSYSEKVNKYLYSYEDIKAKPISNMVGSISPYLTASAQITVESRADLLSDVPPLWFGNMPLDGGHLLLSPEEKTELIKIEPNAVHWIRPVLGAREFLHNMERWCLWLVGISPAELKAMPEIIKRIEKVKKFRLASKAASTRIHAERATEFRDTRTPTSYVLVPKTSSERREYVPMGFFDNETIVTDLNFMIPQATLYHFGVLESKIHMDWMRVVCGRLESRYRYSAKLVYNNFPWPDANKLQKVKIEKSAQAVLDARDLYPDSSLADLYDPLLMPIELRKAHNALDKAVDRCYRKEPFKDDADRLKLLFERYAELTK
ncbi:MAG: hypothetical protein L3J28_03125 [Candidatus Polarisedimenticolaceae bacterium]|nr:hypothetical protein [Candidatus Polarisedimenticolaceae bacterium]